MTDSTNLETDVLRNKIRLQVLPLLKTLNPAVVENIQRTAENLTEAQQVLDVVTGKLINGKVLELSELDKYGSREYFIYQWAEKYGFKGKQVPEIMQAKTGAVFSSAMGYDLLVDRGRLMVEPALKPMKSLKIPETGTYIHDDAIKFSLCMEPVWVSKSADCATVDAEKVCFPLTVRRVGEGDWMIPFGMKGRRLLSDLMTDLKMTQFEKRRQLVVTDAQSRVVWLVGIRTDNRFRVTEATTQVITMHFSEV